MSLAELTVKIEREGHLTRAEARAVMEELLSGTVGDEAIVRLLAVLRDKGETAQEVVGFAEVMRERAARVLRGAGVDLEELARGAPMLDTCGTGGDGYGTFNVSTAAALVAVAAGARVAKHGNRSYTSRCGSADVLEALGVDLARAGERARYLVERIGMAFLFAPAFHPAMRHVGPVRRELAVCTIMNLVGPLVNPAGVRHQVVGVADRDRAPVMADALRRLGAEHALVVHAAAGMDEISPHGETHVWEVRGGRTETWVLDPAHKQEIMQILSKRLSPAVAEDTYAAMVAKTNGQLEPDARLNTEAFHNVLKLRAEIEGSWGGKAPPISPSPPPAETASRRSRRVSRRSAA